MFKVNTREKMKNILIFIFITVLSQVYCQQIKSDHIRRSYAIVKIDDRELETSLEVVYLDGKKGFVIADDVFLYESVANILKDQGVIKIMQLAHYDGPSVDGKKQVVYSNIYYIPTLQDSYIKLQLIKIRKEMLSGYHFNNIMTLFIEYKDLL